MRVQRGFDKSHWLNWITQVHMNVDGESVQDFHAKWTAKPLDPRRLLPSFPFSSCVFSPCKQNLSLRYICFVPRLCSQGGGVFCKMTSGIKLVTPHSTARARALILLWRAHFSLQNNLGFSVVAWVSAVNIENGFYNLLVNVHCC